MTKSAGYISFTSSKETTNACERAAAFEGLLFSAWEWGGVRASRRDERAFHTGTV